jgi:putative transcriptional regulator
MRKSRIIDEAHETLRDLHKLGAIDKQTLRDFEAQVLPPAQYTPDAIRHLRERLHVSQGVFAAYLNASVSTVQKWENGEKKPSGAALRLLSVIERKGLEVLV